MRSGNKFLFQTTYAEIGPCMHHDRVESKRSRTQVVAQSQRTLASTWSINHRTRKNLTVYLEGYLVSSTMIHVIYTFHVPLASVMLSSCFW